MKLAISSALLLLSAALFPVGSARAQSRMPVHPVSLEVYGQARYGDTRLAAANILVRLESFSGGVIGQILSDRDGKFRFSNLSSAQYTLFIHAQGYIEHRHSVDLLTQTSEYVNVFLIPESTVTEARRSMRSIGYVDASVPAEARKEFEKAQTYLYDEKDSAQAMRHLEKAIELHPKFFEAQLSLGTLLMDAGKWEEAETSLQLAVEMNPKSANAFFALGEVCFQQSRLAEAEKFLRAGLQLDNRSWKAHFALARVYWKNEDLVRTGKQLALTLQLNPNSSEAHLLAGKVLLRAGKLDDSKFEFEEYLRLDPKGPYADQARATIKSIKGRLAPKE
jgi:tetratricopeptide (TPR) repeat protein